MKKRKVNDWIITLMVTGVLPVLGVCAVLAPIGWAMSWLGL